MAQALRPLDCMLLISAFFLIGKEVSLMEHVVSFPQLGLQFTVNEVAFRIGTYEIRWYGILIALGFLLGVFYASWAAKKMNIDASALFDAIIVGMIGSNICARLYYVAFYPGDKYINNPMEILKTPFCCISLRCSHSSFMNCLPP